MSTDSSFLTVRVGIHWYGVPLTHVIEVVNLVALTEMPAAPPYTLGLMTLRQMIMPVIDLRVRFQLDDAPLSLNTPLVALQGAHKPFAIVVDEVNDVYTVTGECITQSGSPFVREAIQRENGLLLLLNMESLSTDL